MNARADGIEDVPATPSQPLHELSDARFMAVLTRRLKRAPGRYYEHANLDLFVDEIARRLQRRQGGQP